MPARIIGMIGVSPPQQEFELARHRGRDFAAVHW